MQVRQGQWSKLNYDAEVLWETYRRDRCHENRNLLAIHYRPFAEYVARVASVNLAQDVHTDLDDLTSSAAIALLDCVERFDSGRGIAFTSFSSLRLMGACIDHVREMDWVPRLERKAEKRGEVTPLVTRSIHETTGLGINGDLETHLDKIENRAKSEPAQAGANSEFFEEACKSCSQHERTILIAYYQDDLTMKEIGAMLGISESRISQCHSAIIKRLKKNWIKHGKPSDRVPQVGRRGARAHFEDVRGVQPAQEKDGGSSGDILPDPVREVESVPSPRRQTVSKRNRNQGRGVPPRKRRRLDKRGNLKIGRRQPVATQRGARNQPVVHKKHKRPLVPGKKGAK